eukprot:gene12969-17266_t
MGVFVYMLRCADGSYYVGSASGEDLQPRIDQHNSGFYKGYTYSRRPVVVVWSDYFDRITDGIAAERQIKGWSRAKKEALIRSDWALNIHPSRRAPHDDGCVCFARAFAFSADATRLTGARPISALIVLVA